MTPENFAYWLQGYSEICGETPTPEQWKVIQDHLSIVFKKETPVYIPYVVEEPKYIDGFSPTYDQWKSFGEFGQGTIIGPVTPTGDWPQHSC